MRPLFLAATSVVVGFATGHVLIGTMVAWCFIINSMIKESAK